MPSLFGRRVASLGVIAIGSLLLFTGRTGTMMAGDTGMTQESGMMKQDGGSVLVSPSAAPELGQKAPDFTLPGTPDEPVRLSQYAGKRVVVLHFYLGDFLTA